MLGKGTEGDDKFISILEILDVLPMEPVGLASAQFRAEDEEARVKVAEKDEEEPRKAKAVKLQAEEDANTS